MTQAINFRLIQFLLLSLLTPAIVIAGGNNSKFSGSNADYAPTLGAQAQALSITCPENITINIMGSACEANFNLPAPTLQAVGCSGAPSLVVSSSLNYQNGMVINAPLGVHLISMSATNTCGQVATCQFMVTVHDNKKPTPSVINTLFANLTAEGQVEIRARQLNMSSYDNCTPAAELKFAFSAEITDSIRVFGCQEVGNNPVQIWVFDESGNKMATSTKVIVLNPNQVCNALSVQGKIELGDGRNFDGATVSVNNNSMVVMATTDESGIFGPLPLDNTTTTVIEPSYDSNVLNGVTTYDIWMIQKAVLGQATLTPYQMIAGDVNGSKTLTVADANEIRKTILGLQEGFSIQKSWQFVDADFDFPASGNILQLNIPENKALAQGLAGNIQADFIGIKLGDLNHSSLVGFQSDEVQPRAKNTVQLNTTDRLVRKNERIEVPFQLDEGGVQGIQFSLEWDTDALEYEYAGDTDLAGLMESGVSLQHKNGKLFFNLSWSSIDKSINATSNIITISFITKTEGLLSNFLRISEFNLHPEAFYEGGTTMHDVKLNYKQQESAQATFPILHLDSNIPNPFIEFTSINFALDKEAHLLLEFFDALGQKVHEQSGLFVAGANNFIVRRADLKDPGIFTYRISSQEGYASRKIMMF